jgi:membrane-bound serine protease (ClpP class)
MRKHFVWCISLFFILLFASNACAAASNRAILLNINGAIGPASEDYVQRGIDYAAAQHASLIILRLDTPGGLAASMHDMSKAIIDSPIPVVTYVAPAGARAASAGTFILYASHVAAMTPGTNLGAASPVSMGSDEPGNPTIKQINTQNLSTHERKAMNDASAYIRSLAELRGRNAEWAENAVRNAASLSATQALQQKVIDVVADSTPNLLQQINGRIVTVKGAPQTLDTQNMNVEEYKPDWRIQLLSALSDPNIAYILLLIGIYGLFFEFYNPGLVLPGVAGAISLLFALYAFQLLPINYVGFALLLLGVSFMIVEVLISSFGILGIGGVIAFVAGSILLLDVNSPGYHIAWSLIIAMTVFTLVFFLILITMSVRAMRRKVITGKEALIGSEGTVIEIFNSSELLVRIKGEIWKAHSPSHVQRGQKVIVNQLNGLILTVAPSTLNKHSSKIE